MEKMRDSIDFKNTDIKTLFRKLLLPTVLGMIFSALFVITDGIFVGKGIGSDALAAVNIVAPLWLFSTGVGLMFGVGASVVASIHLSHGKVKVARINITQSVVISSLLLMCTSTLFCSFAPQVVKLLGGSERLTPLAVEYMLWFGAFLSVHGIAQFGYVFSEAGRFAQLRHDVQCGGCRSEHPIGLSVHLPLWLGNVRCRTGKCHRYHGRCIDDSILSDAPPVRTALSPH